MFVGISNEQPLGICARVDVATVWSGLCKGHPPWHIPTEFVWYMTMYVYSMLFVQRNSIPSNKILTKYRLHKSCGR